jgi:hypothetical protein
VDTLGKTLLAAAIVLALVGGALLVLSHLLTRFPGDVVMRGKNVTVYAPLGLTIFVSLVLTIVLNLLWRR